MGKCFFHNAPLPKNDGNWQKLRQKIGMVFQSYHLFPHMTVLENILLGPLKVQKRNKNEALKQAEQLLRKVGLLEKKRCLSKRAIWRATTAYCNCSHSLYES